MADILIAQYKEKEFKRLTDYCLNLMSVIEVGLNIDSVSRGLYNEDKEVWVPSTPEIEKLSSALFELRSNILTSEERELLSEKK